MESRDQALSSLESEVGVLLGRIRRVIGERAHRLHPELQSGSYLILGHIAEHGPIRATAIGEAFSIDKGSVSRHVQQLIDLDLISRAPDPQDGRALLLSVTDHGTEQLARVAAERREVLSDKMADWSDGEIEDFVRRLARYNAMLSD